jgi:deoxyribose-phosphate aldolase
MLDDIPEALFAKLELSLPDPIATAADVEELCQAAMEHKARGVCFNGSRLIQASDLLQDSEVKLTALVGFPLGASDPDAKRFEAEAALDAGAHELEVAMNLGLLKDQDYRAVLRELRDIVEAVDGLPVKVIIESTLLTEPERNEACQIVLDSGAQFVSTSGGLIAAPADPGEWNDLRELITPDFGLKAGGLRELDPTADFSKVDRIGLLLRLRGVAGRS